MKFLGILVLSVMLSMGMSANAHQVEGTHIISNQENIINKDSLSLVNRITKDSLKLINLKGQIEEKTRNKEETANEAQRIANENNIAAKRLSKDPLHKKMARKADRLSEDARKKAKKARKAADALNGLNKDISSLERKIAKEQTKLNKIRNATH